MFARRFAASLILGSAVLIQVLCVDLALAADYASVHSIFAEHCLDCHGAPDPEAKLILETYDDLVKGGQSGPLIVPRKSAESLLVKMIEGAIEKEGKKIVMPPGKRKKLQPGEIAALKAWIDEGAAGPPAGKTRARDLDVPKITPNVSPRRSIQALAYAATPRLIAIGRYGEVELISAESRASVRKLAGHRGSVNALVFSQDGKRLFAAGGEPAMFGEVRQWNAEDGSLVRKLEGHRDALYSMALSPDGRILATGSYDQKIKLWEAETGKELRTLSGHNGAVFDLSFRADGKILASASADRTVKLWDVATGERRDTLAQSLKELHTAAFSPDGKRLAAGGVDNRIRVWQVSETAAETSNPLLEARFAHEGAILKLVFSADGKTLASSSDDRTVKIWDGLEIKEKSLLESQPDWPSALTFALDNQALIVGRLDGTIQFYDAANGKVLPPPKPALVRVEPRGIQRGVESKIRLVVSNLVSLTEVKFHNPKLSGRLIRESDGTAAHAWAVVNAEPSLPRGSYELSLVSTNGESGKIQLHVDDLPQIYLTSRSASATEPVKLPVSVWATHEKIGDTEEIQFEARPGQTLVFDVAAKRLGSKSEVVLTLFDAAGRMLATSGGSEGSREPLLVHTFDAGGRYSIRAGEWVLGASVDHYYRLSIGEFPYATGCYPLSVASDRETEVELLGSNLPPEQKIKVKAAKPGEMALPLDSERFRSRREFKLLVSELPESFEREPNDLLSDAMRIEVPASIAGRIWNRTISSPNVSGSGERGGSMPDRDLFQFEAKAGQSWIIETTAAQRGTPTDTRVEVLNADGKPVERVLLQAVRNSAITFRGIDSNAADCRVENWEEMELNQYLYLQGEVVRLFRAPQGPDSGFVFYTSAGKRRNYFDTSATAHANEEPCYIVEPHLPGSRLVASGLPVFPVFFANDDDGERRLGTDSRVHFTAPADGSYWIRVTDSRGYGGERFVYRLVVREPRPDFKVTLGGTNLTVNAGSGQGFSVSVDRSDGFDGEVKVEIEKVPKGFSVASPLVIQAGHNEAKGAIYADFEAPPPSEADSTNIVVNASAVVQGRIVTKPVNGFGRIKLGEKPKLWVSLEPDSHASANSSQSANPSRIAGAPAEARASRPFEITLAPGQIVPAWLRIRRNGHDDLVTFTVENLPHGVIVDNIGLNGVLIPKDQNERQIFLTAAKWVPETDRLCYAVEAQTGRQASLPVLLRVRKSDAHVTTAAK